MPSALPWPASVYAVDKASAVLCTGMQRTGFAFDAGRASTLSDHLWALEEAAHARAADAVGRPLVTGRSGALSPNDLQRAFFGELHAPIYYRSRLTRKPSLGVDAMRGYAACHSPELRQLALAVLDARRARKVRSTYIQRVVQDFLHEGRVHPTWQTFGAVSGRWSCRDPNLMNLPRAANDPTHGMGGVRSLYVAPPGKVLVWFDASQLEMRIAAYASGDAAMIGACEGSDLHSANAATIFGPAFEAADPPARKALRSMAKNAGFAVCYMAQASTVYARLLADGQDVKLAQCEALLRKLHSAFWQYYKWQDQGLMACVRTGYVETPMLGRRRFLGHDPSPTEAANFPIQGGAADLMNSKLAVIVPAVERGWPDARAVAQVHDSCVFEVRSCDAGAVLDYCEEEFTRPVTITSSGEPLVASFPIDREQGERWA